MSGELERWAAERAPELLAKAEAEAVATLRRALVAAALGEREAAAPPEPAAPREPADAPRPDGELLWLYCVMGAGEAEAVRVPGVDPAALVERIDAAGLAALVSRVPAVEFGEEPLRRNLNDLAWLERVARAHESVLEQALRAATIVPLRLCTLYAGEDGVREMLAGEREAFADALAYLGGRQEWGAKVTVDPALVTRAARDRHHDPVVSADDMADRGGGGAYMLRRRFERDVRALGHAIVGELAEGVHARLEAEALESVTLRPQNRDLSRHEGEMVLNAAYLVDADRVDELRRLAEALEREHAALGTRIELTGPWPPYNFVPGGGPAGLS